MTNQKSLSKIKPIPVSRENESKQKLHIRVWWDNWVRDYPNTMPPMQWFAGFNGKGVETP